MGGNGRFAEVTAEEERRLLDLVLRFTTLEEVIAALGPPDRDSIREERRILEYARLSETATLLVGVHASHGMLPLVLPKELGHACSFCGLRQSQVARLIAGPNAYICDECIFLCLEIVSESDAPSDVGRTVLEGVQILVAMPDGTVFGCVRQSRWAPFEIDGTSYEWCAARGFVGKQTKTSTLLAVRKQGETGAARGEDVGGRPGLNEARAREFVLGGGAVIAWSSDLEGGAKTMTSPNMDATSAVVRYQVRDVDRAVAFYTEHLGFTSKRPGAALAILTRGHLQLIASGPEASGPRPMPDGRKQEPGGWNRIVLYMDDLDATIASLRRRDAKFRNAVAVGPGGKQIQIEDPDGNPVELHEAPKEK